MAMIQDLHKASSFRRPGWAGLVALVSAASIGCEVESGAVEAPMVWDTVEVERYMISSDSAAVIDQHQQWSLNAEPILEIGESGRDGEYTFSTIRDAVVLESGVVVVGDWMANELIFFDAEGRHIATAGGQGDGPGEFQLLWWLGECAPDQVFAYDARNGRASILSREGDFIDAFSLVAPGGVPVDSPSCSTQGLFAAPGFPPWREQMIPGRFISSAPLFLVDPSSGAADSIVHNFPARELIGTASGEPMAPPFYQSTVLGVWQDQVYAGFSRRYEVGVFSRSGVPQAVFGLDIPPRPVEQGDAQGYVELLVGDRAGRVAESLERFGREHMPEVFPFFDRLLVAADGDVWIRRHPSPTDAASRWDIFSPGQDYEYRGHILIPEAFEVLDVAGERVVGAWRGDFDETYLRVYRLELTTVNSGV